VSAAAAAGPALVTAEVARATPAPRAEVIWLEGISKGYGTGEARAQALRGVSLAITEGEFVGLTGPSGSGKSTLLNILGLLDQPDTGSYRFDGREIVGLPEDELVLRRRASLGFVFQGFNLVPVLTALENVEYPLLLDGTRAPERKRRVLEVLDQVGLAGLSARLPDALSGGQRQRVAIARALVKRPRLVLADEPTANLDGATAAQVIDLMRSLGHQQRTTFVVATHDARLISRCDRVVALADGVVS
jgi:putative ABC transport system ATP-binding protein